MSARLSRRAEISLPDSQCGFRLIHLDTWRKMELRTEHFEIESEILMASVRLGIPVKFVPVAAIYGRERSAICPVSDTIRWFRWFFRESWGK